jgi:hypothetical protein
VQSQGLRIRRKISGLALSHAWATQKPKTCADWLTASNGPHGFDNTSRCPKKNEYEEDGERVMANARQHYG